MTNDKKHQQLLMKNLTDVSYIWTRDSLMETIVEELSNDDAPLNMMLIDAAVARMLMLDGKELTNQNLHQLEETIMCGILRKELGMC